VTPDATAASDATAATAGPRLRGRPRVQLAVAAMVGLGVISIWPLRLVGRHPHDDILLHLGGGLALALALTALCPRATHAIVLLVGAASVVWEPVEWWLGTQILATMPTLTAWLLREDTLFDISLGILGALLAMLLAGRYRPQPRPPPTD